MKQILIIMAVLAMAFTNTACDRVKTLVNETPEAREQRLYREAEEKNLRAVDAMSDALKSEMKKQLAEKREEDRQAREITARLEALERAQARHEKLVTGK